MVNKKNHYSNIGGGGYALLTFVHKVEWKSGKLIKFCQRNSWVALYRWFPWLVLSLGIKFLRIFYSLRRITHSVSYDGSDASRRCGATPEPDWRVAPSQIKLWETPQKETLCISEPASIKSDTAATQATLHSNSNITNAVVPPSVYFKYSRELMKL